MNGCHSPKPASEITGGSEMLDQRQWELTELPGLSPLAVGPNKLFLSFKGGQVNNVSGFTGCNRLSGTFELTGASLIKFSPLASAKMACMGDNIETPFLQALDRVNNCSITDNQLLLNNGKKLVAKFTAASTENAALVGSWQLNYISGRRIAFEGLYPDKKPKISFDFKSNELNGNTTCNPFSRKFTIEANKINISAPNAMTLSVCEGEGEKAFPRLLQKENKYSVQDNTLTFLIDDVAVMRFAKK